MSRYDFVNPGAAAADALRALMVQREAQARQAQLDAMKAENEAHARKMAEESNALAKRTAARQDEMFDVDRSGVAAESLGINGRIDANDPMAALIQKHQPGILDTDMTLAARHSAGTPGIMVTQDIAPEATGMLRSRGTSGQRKDESVRVERISQREDEQRFRDEQARAQATERATQAEANRQAAAERAREANMTREQIAALAASGRGETNALRAELLRQQIGTAADKRTDATDKQAKQQQEADDYAREVTSLIDQLVDKDGNLAPDAARNVGMFDANTMTIREDSATGLSKIDRLIGLLDIDTLRRMKSQSRTGATGFGALSAPELAIIENAASTLKHRGVSEGAYAAELKRIRDGFKKGAQPAAGATQEYDYVPGKGLVPRK